MYELERLSAGERVLDQQRFHAAAHEHELDADFARFEQKLHELPLPDQVDAHEFAGFWHVAETVVRKRHEASTFERGAGRRGHVIQEVDVSAAAMGIVPLNFPAV